MRGLMIIVVLVLLTAALAWAGWITFSQDDDRATISIDKAEVKQDLREAQAEGSKVLEKAGETLDPDPEPVTPLK